MKSANIGALTEALAKAQAVMTSPSRNREVTVARKSGGSYKFKYATLDHILESVRKPLTDNGLWFTQTLANGDGKYRLVTTLMHTSGEWVESEQPLFLTDQSNQAFGSALTYAKRYALAGMLGIAADEDDDANHADGNTVKESTDRKAAPKPTGNAPAAAKDKAANSAGVDPTVAWATAKNKSIAAAKTFEELAVIDAEVRNNASLAETTRNHLLANLDKMQKHLAGGQTKHAAE